MVLIILFSKLIYNIFMGNGKSISNNKSNTEQMWDNIKTENMSATLHGIKGLSNDAKKLIANLNLPAFTDVETSEFNVNKILGQINSNLNESDKQKFHKILDEMSPVNYNDTVLSETSPFMSNEMYDKLVNSKTSEDEMDLQSMMGGSYKSKENKLFVRKGGNNILEKSSSSSTSSTSSLSDSSSISSSSSHKKHHNKKHHNKKHHEKKHHETSEESVQSGGDDLSYISSSAHENSEANSEESHVKSVSDENNLEETSISVNTSDINMVSDY